MQPGPGQHDNSMRGFNGYMPPSQGMPYNMQQQQQQQQQQHGQAPNMNHRPGPGMQQMPQNVRSHSNPNMPSNQENHYMGTNPPLVQRSVTSPYGGPLPSPNQQVMGMGGMGGGYQGLSDMGGGGLPPAHGGMPHNGQQQQQQGMGMNNPGGGNGGGYPVGLSPHQTGRNEYGLQHSDNTSHFPTAQGQHLQQHQRFGVGGLSQGLGGGSREEQEFTIHDGDFPALPGSAVKALQGDGGGGGGGGSMLHPSMSLSLSPNSLPIHLDGGSSPSLTPLSPSLKAANQQASSAATAKYMSSRSEAEMKYGLLGLLDVIKMTNRDLNTLALGCDLTTFGLNLNSTDSLYASFTSPFAAQAVSTEPNYTTPASYRMHPPTLKADHSSKFQVETLFFMFYAMPKDLLQATAAEELYQREWKYHGEQRLWLKARTQQELMQSHPTVQYVYFDVNVWEARLFTNTPAKGHISSGFLTEEEIAVKPANMMQQTPPRTVTQSQQGQKQQQAGGVAMNSRVGSSSGSGGSNGDNSSKFQVETLFYMFYSSPKDLLQAAAAQELYQRDWKYHGEQRLWLKARTQQELMQSHPTVQYVYFDVNAWEARLFTNTPAKGHISSGFLTEEDIAVKPSNMSPHPQPQGGVVSA